MIGIPQDGHSPRSSSWALFLTFLSGADPSGRSATALRAPLAAGALALFLPACWAGSPHESAVETTVGRATFRDIALEVPKILGEHGYSIHESRRTRRTVTFETNWRYRAPFEDEADRGADAVRTRLHVEAWKSGGNAYTLRIRAENEVHGVPGASGPAGGTGWSTIPATDMYRAYIQELSMTIRLEVDAGVRVR